MAFKSILKRGWLIGLAGFLGWSLIFGIIYAQSPLYTNNQNAYFLHGLADAGYGYLSRDWLAGLPESMPVFTGLVYVTYALFHSKIPFYLYYALILGVYLASMYGIMDLLFDLRRSKMRSLVFVALFLAVHSAALRFVLSKVVNADASFLLEGGVANQRLLGQVFQPSVFGVFLILSIYLFLKKKPYWSLLPLAVAIYFHPVYFLSGALLTLAYMWVVFRERRNWKSPLLLGAAALLLVAPYLIYTIRIFSAPSSQVAQKALDILVNFRNPHHALVWAWVNWTTVVQLIILAAGLYLTRKTRLFPIVLIVSIGTLVLTAVQVVTASNWLAYIFPWRVSVLLVPLGTTVLIAWAVTKLMDRMKEAPVNQRWIALVCLAGIAGLMAVGVIRFQLENARDLADPAREMMDYVAAHRTPDDVYLIPAGMDDFRLVTGEPVYVDFKSAPDRDQDVLEWYDRLQAVFWFYGGSPDPCATLREYAAQKGITRAVVGTNDPFTTCKSFETPYNDGRYEIYILNANPVKR